MLILKIVEDLESEVVMVRGVSGWRGVGGDEGGEGGRWRYDRGHGEGKFAPSNFYVWSGLILQVRCRDFKHLIRRVKRGRLPSNVAPL